MGLELDRTLLVNRQDRAEMHSKGTGRAQRQIATLAIQSLPPNGNQIITIKRIDSIWHLLCRSHHKYRRIRDEKRIGFDNAEQGAGLIRTGTEPDFVVETTTGKFICEPKRASEVSNDVVQSKADAAAIWCEYATVHAKTYGGKPWTYLLIPHDQVSEQMSLAGLAARCTYA